MSGGTRELPGTDRVDDDPTRDDPTRVDPRAALLADDAVFVKRRAGAPPGLFAVEAAGLRWLSAVEGGVPVVEPISVSDDALVLPRLPEVAPTSEAGAEFGRRLAVTHAAGARHHGSAPDGWDSDGYIGPLRLPMQTGPTWAAWYAEHRLLPYLRRAHDDGTLGAEQSATLSRLLDRLVGEPDLGGPPEPPARLHGDLWNGNVMWTGEGVVLIDPAAHGGHRETDLAMLQLFGLPHLRHVLAAYDEAVPLADGWQDRVALHQVHPLLVHAVLFGGGYAGRAAELAGRYV